MRLAVKLVIDIYEIFMQQIGDMGHHNTLTAGIVQELLEIVDKEMAIHLNLSNFLTCK